MDLDKIENIIKILTEINSTSNAEQIMNVMIEVININGLIVDYKKNHKMIVNKLKLIKSILNNLYTITKKNTESIENIKTILKSKDFIKQSLAGSTLCVNETEDFILEQKKNGTDIIRFKSGAIYEGGLKDDKYDGKGVYKYKNGDKYEGDYKDGKKEGKGVYYYKRGDRYEGEYKNDEKEGRVYIIIMMKKMTV